MVIKGDNVLQASVRRTRYAAERPVPPPRGQPNPRDRDGSGERAYSLGHGGPGPVHGGCRAIPRCMLRTPQESRTGDWLRTIILADTSRTQCRRPMNSGTRHEAIQDSIWSPDPDFAPRSQSLPPEPPDE